MTTVKGRVTTVKGHATAVKGRMNAVKGHMNAVKGRANAVKGRATPVKGRATAVKGRATPVKGRATAGKGRANAGKGRATAFHETHDPASGARRPYRARRWRMAPRRALPRAVTPLRRTNHLHAPTGTRRHTLLRPSIPAISTTSKRFRWWHL